ncbi:MAG: group 1 truncated hemoglobin [Flavobacteriales bacterium]|nr:group 1 truncated hemoglobin [Flavobacteriales bacterium]
MSNKIKLIIVFFSGWLFFISSCNTHQPSDNLFQELGGLDTLELVTDAWIDSLKSDATLSVYFTNLFNDSIATLNFRNHLVDQFCSLSGGPCVYKGRSMELVHQPLQIQSEDFDKTIYYLRNILNTYITNENTVLNFIVRIQSLEPSIVGP